MPKQWVDLKLRQNGGMQCRCKRYLFAHSSKKGWKDFSQISMCLQLRHQQQEEEEALVNQRRDKQQGEGKGGRSSSNSQRVAWETVRQVKGKGSSQVSGLRSLVSQLVQPVPSQSGVIYLHSSYKLYCKQTTSFNFNLKNCYLCWRMLPRPLTTQQPSRETARHFARQTKSEQEAGGTEEAHSTSTGRCICWRSWPHQMWA